MYMLAPPAFQFLFRQLEAAGFVISRAKTVLLGSPPRLARAVAAYLMLGGYTLPVRRAGTYLGVTVTLAARRRATAASAMGADASRRERLLGRFAQSDARARRLHIVSSYAKASWGLTVVGCSHQ